MSTEIVTWILFFINGFQYYYILCALFEQKINNIYLGGTVYTGICLIMRYVSGLYEGQAYYISAMVSLLLQVLLIFILFRVKRWYHAWIVEGTFKVLVILLQIPLAVLAELITGSNVLAEINGSDFDLNYVIVTSLNCMLYMLIVFAVYIIRFKRRYVASWMISCATLGVVIYQIIVMTFFYMLCWEKGDNAVMGGVLFVLFSIISQMAILKSLEHMLEKMHIEREWRRLSAQRQLEYEHYQKVQETIEQMRMERHDYMNYMQAVERLLSDSKDYKEVCGLLQEIRIRDRS